MKKFMMKAGLFIFVTFMMTGCNEPIVWDDSVGLIGFSTPLVTLKEGETAQFGVFFSAPAGTGAININLATTTQGAVVPATEGTDFTLSSKALNMAPGSQTITITATDDNNYTGNKSCYIVVGTHDGNYPVALPNAVKVIIIENEHPLTAWVGTYNVTAASYYETPTYDEEWLGVTTDIVPSDATKLQIRGISVSGSGPVVATLNPTNLTIEIESGQSLGQPYGSENGNMSIYYATDDIIANNWMPITPEMLNAAAAHKITGTIQANGTILLDKFAIVNPDELWVWDVYNTTWTKQK